MEIVSSCFLCSYTRARDCVSEARPEFALIGRSNVGKSSLINMLLGKKALAKTSARPGKTRMLNLFLVNEAWLLMDMPGYGWAQLPQSEKKRIAQENKAYLRKRRALLCLLILLDLRLPPQAIDLRFIYWIGQQRIPFVLVFTKADKLPKSQIQHKVLEYQQTLQKTWKSLPQHFITSAPKRKGRTELLNFLEETMNRFCPVAPQMSQKEQNPSLGAI